jgi:hypothetical protein
MSLFSILLAPIHLRAWTWRSISIPIHCVGFAFLLVSLAFVTLASWIDGRAPAPVDDD